MNQPNPSAVRAIWNRVFAWAVESGRIPQAPDVPEEPKVTDATPMGVVCKKCKSGELHLHRDGRMCGCEKCNQLFRYPSMEQVV